MADEPTGHSLDGWERARMRMGAQNVYRALLTWAVEHAASNLTEPRSRLRREREHGHGDMLIRAAIAAYGDDDQQAEQRISEDWAETMADKA